MLKCVLSSKHRIAKRVSAVLFGATVGAGSLIARAATYAEVGDAGQLHATAQVVSAAMPTTLSTITGTLSKVNGISDADLYRIVVSSPSTFSATTTNFVPGSNNFDSQLFLFTTSGAGIAADDDAPNSGSSQSTLPAGNSLYSGLPAGAYDLLITGSDQYPASAGGAIFPNFTDANGDDPTVVYGPTGPGGAGVLSTYTGTSNEDGNYSIALTGASFVTVSVPEPATGAIVLSALCCTLVVHRKRLCILQRFEVNQ